MAREKKPMHKVVMADGKRNSIHQFLPEYEILTAGDIQDAPKWLIFQFYFGSRPSYIMLSSP